MYRPNGADFYSADGERRYPFLGELKHYYVTFAICHRNSVCLSLSCVTFMQPTQGVELMSLHHIIVYRLEQ